MLSLLSLLLFCSAFQAALGVDYTMVVETSGSNKAGTDANIWIKIFGTDGTITKDISNAGSFEKGGTDTIHFRDYDRGCVTGMQVKRDRAGFFSDWKLNQIIFKIPGKPKSKFVYNGWIRPDRWITLPLSCESGYRVNNKGCCDVRDVDECQNSPCIPPATCVNTVGSYHCNCPRGFTLKTGSKHECEDVNECNTGNHNCDNQTTTCSNVPGSYKCQCRVGYQPRSLYKCQDINECITGKPCDLQSTTCSNNIGSYTCQCKDGYETGQSQLNECQAKQCNVSAPLGMQDGQIRNQSITASSHYAKYPPWEARLNSGKAKSWYAFASDKNAWIQVDLGKPTWLKGVATQGKMFSMFVKTYKLTYSSDEITWFTYRERDSKVDKVFKGNTNPYEAVKVELDKPVYTRYVRLYPKSWKDAVALKLELFGCRPE